MVASHAQLLCAFSLQEKFEAAIEGARKQTVDEVQRWRDGGRDGGNASSATQEPQATPVRAPPAEVAATPDSAARRRCPATPATPRGAGMGGGGGTPHSAYNTPASAFGDHAHARAAAMAGVEARILAKVAAVCSPHPGATTRLAPRRPGAAAGGGQASDAGAGAVVVAGGGGGAGPAGSLGATPGAALLKKAGSLAGSKGGAQQLSSRRGGVFKV